MGSPRDTYTRLIKQYLRNEVDATEFRTRYFDRFKSESRAMSDELFGVLDALFADLDCLVEDEELLQALRKTEPRPGWYLDEPQLRARAEHYLKRLRKGRR